MWLWRLFLRWHHIFAFKSQQNRIVVCLLTNHLSTHAAHSSGLCRRSALSEFKNKPQKMLNGPTVAFAVCEPFDFPKPSLLMASQQHETWHVIYYSVHVPCYLSPAPYGPCCLQTPKSLSPGQGLFLWQPSHCSSSSEEWGDDDEQSQPEQTFCLKFWQDIQQLTVSALLAQLLIHASWQSGGNNYERWKDWK